MQLSHPVSFGLALQTPVTYKTIDATKEKVTFFQSQFLDLGNSVMTWGECFQLVGLGVGVLALSWQVSIYVYDKVQKHKDKRGLR